MTEWWQNPDEDVKWTAEEFALNRYNLPDGGRWTELIAGQPVALSPPDDKHGTVVLNLTKALAEFAQRERVGYACFEVGLVLSRSPDTVRCPPISYFTRGDLFAESDRDITQEHPTLVVEIASTNDRRSKMAERVQSYLNWGVPFVWVIDTAGKVVHLFGARRPARQVSGEQKLTGSDDLAAFEMPAADLFKEPSWWQAAGRNGH